MPKPLSLLLMEQLQSMFLYEQYAKYSNASTAKNQSVPSQSEMILKSWLVLPFAMLVQLVINLLFASFYLILALFNCFVVMTYFATLCVVYNAVKLLVKNPATYAFDFR